MANNLGAIMLTAEQEKTKGQFKGVLPKMWALYD